jgi:integrase
MSELHFTPPAAAEQPTPDQRAGRPAGKPAKPYIDFPLFAHNTRRWAKKIRGKLHYFGPWSDPQGALDNYLKQKDALHAGRLPRPEPDGELTVKAAVNAYLNAKVAARDAGEITPATWRDYKQSCDFLIEQLGKGRLVADLGPDDFARLRGRMTERWGPTVVGVMIQRVRSVFKHAFDNRLTPTPPYYGSSFKRPAKKVLRLQRAARGPQLFTAEEIHRLLAAARVQLKAMILLGINCGLGNADCGRLQAEHLDLAGGWLDYPRPKTGLPRRCPLWPETVAALREVLANRPQPRDPAALGLVFVTHPGGPWGDDHNEHAIAKVFIDLRRAAGINGRKGLGFYALRHTFRTVADEARDQPAADLIMGHEVPHMSSVYRETISDARLRAVAEHVRSWLFPATGQAGADLAE